MQRCAVTNYDIVPCIAPKGRYWVGGLRRILKVSEICGLMGVDAATLQRCEVANASESLLRDCMGNSFPAPVIAAILLGALVS